MKRLKIILLLSFALVTQLHAKYKIAIVGLDASEEYKIIAEELVDKFADRLSKSDKFTLIEREYITAILEEQKLQMLGIIESSAEVGKLLGVDGITVGKLTSYFERSATNMYTGNYYSAKVINTVCGLRAFMKLIDVTSGKVIYTSMADKEVNWKGYTDIIEGEIKAETTYTLLEETHMLSAAGKCSWGWDLSEGDILQVSFSGDDDVEIRIGLPDGGYYPQTYRKAISGNITFTIPENKEYRVVIENPSFWWTRTVHIEVQYTQKYKGIGGALIVLGEALDKNEEENILKRSEPKSPEEVRGILLDSVAVKWANGLCGVRADNEKIQINPRKYEVKKFKFQKGKKVTVIFEVSKTRKIDFMIFDETNYGNWLNKRTSIPIIELKKTSYIKEEFIVPHSGWYYFIMDNRKSTFFARTLLLTVKAPIL